MSGDRRVLVTLGLATLLVSAGCSFLQGPVTFEANQSTVSTDARQGTGYEEVRVEDQTVTRRFGSGNVSQEVRVVNKLAEYKRQVSVGLLEGELARFSVFTSPGVEVAGQEFNPVSDMSNAELAMLVQEKYGTVSDVRLQGNRTVELLGRQATVSKFTASAQTVGGQSVDVYLHIGQVAHEGDYVVVIAVYPQQLQEEENVDRLVRGVEHETG